MPQGRKPPLTSAEKKKEDKNTTREPRLHDMHNKMQDTYQGRESKTKKKEVISGHAIMRCNIRNS